MAQVVVAVIGIALIVAPVLANQAWLDRHFLPSFMMSRTWYVAIETAVRVALAATGFALIFTARRVSGRFMTIVARYGVALVIAFALAVAASEIALQRVHLRPAEWRILDEEPRREPDPELGWRFIPNRVANATSGGRTIQYAFDAAGYRVRGGAERVDLDRPSLLFAGESVIFGDGLTYDESVPAQVEAILGIQAANFGVYGYSTDQAFLRLRRELPRFRQPVAVIVPFLTTLFGRNLDVDRPHLARGLVWQPARERGRIVTLTGLFFPFRRDTTIENGIVATRDVFAATVALARARQATPLVVVPHLGPESKPEESLRRRILDEAAVPYVFVPLDSTWHITWDHHPDARAARAIATAIAARLRADRTTTLSSTAHVENSQ
jgi:hypothetical protein